MKKQGWYIIDGGATIKFHLRERGQFSKKVQTSIRVVQCGGTEKGEGYMEQNWLEQLQQTGLTEAVLQTNRYTEKYGLVLSREETEAVLAERQKSLKEQRRVEFGQGILPRIIQEFCDSVYISQSNYVETLVKLQDIFYLYKNEMQDEITDDELLHFMKEQFETVCFGDFDYLEGTCLSNFAQAIRAGYRGHRASDGYGEYAQFDEVTRWDYGLYLAALEDLF